jgi:hypothetical protein
MDCFGGLPGRRVEFGPVEGFFDDVSSRAGREELLRPFDIVPQLLEMTVVYYGKIGKGVAVMLGSAAFTGVGGIIGSGVVRLNGRGEGLGERGELEEEGG